MFDFFSHSFSGSSVLPITPRKIFGLSSALSASTVLLPSVSFDGVIGAEAKDSARTAVS